MRKQLVRSAIACSIALFTSAAAHAESIRLYQAGDVPDPRVVARILGAKPASFAHLPKTRGLFYTPDEAAPVAPEISDSGQNVTEDQLTDSADAALKAWQERLGRSTRGERQVAMANPVPIAEEKASARAVVERKSPPQPPTTKLEQPGSLALAIGFENNSARLGADMMRALDAVAEGIKIAGNARRFLIEGHTSATGRAGTNLRLSQLRAESVKRYLIERHGISGASLTTRGFGSTKPVNRSNPYAAENRRVQFRVLSA